MHHAFGICAASMLLLALAAAQQPLPHASQAEKPICDHAPPPPGKHYECAPGNTCDCRLVRDPDFQEQDGVAAPLPPAVACRKLAVEKFVAPVYPAIANQARIAGTVRIQLVYGAAGNVEQARVLSGHPLLVPSALEALKQWKFRPTGKAGTTEIQVDYVLSKKVADHDRVRPKLPCSITIEGHPKPVVRD